MVALALNERKMGGDEVPPPGAWLRLASIQTAKREQIIADS